MLKYEYKYIKMQRNVYNMSVKNTKTHKLKSKN